MEKSEKHHVTTKTLAMILGVDDSTIRKLTAGMVLSREKRGTYELVDSVQRFIKYQVSLAKKNYSGNKTEEETRLIRAKADLTEIELAAARGDMITVGAATKLLSHLILAARSNLLALPSRTKTKHPEIDVAIIQDVENEIRDVLAEMANTPLPENWIEKQNLN
ncbi:MAG: hypothetical protein KBA61_08125 [Spirochaetes bacterium]|nr:hypothetical protein [Spirochaetota bacterium]